MSRPPPLLLAAGIAFLLLLPVACGPAGAGDDMPSADPRLVPGVEELSAAGGSQSGQVRLQLRPASGSGQSASGQGDPIRGFDVRAQVAHITADNAAQAPVVKDVQRSTQADGSEILLLSGLEPGRVLQIAVRAVGAQGAGAFSPSVSARVTGQWAPALPAGVIRVTQSGDLDQEGRHYLLDNDIVTPGTAFRITARDVTLDLGGHTITYGSGQDDAHGIYSAYLYNRGRLTIVNGTIQQAGGHRGCDAIHLRGGHDIRVSRVAVRVQGPDSDGITIWDGLTGDLRVDHCTIACNTTSVGNRHDPGVCALRVEGATQSVELDANLITASPQWGIKVSGKETRGALLIHHNRVLGTRARVANGYMIGVHQPQADVFENELAGESRGIHLDGIDGDGHNARIHDNVIRAQDQPNAEFPEHWCHGIKVEGSTSAWLFNNVVLVEADAGHSEARALDLSLQTSTDIVIRRNRFAGVSTVSEHLGIALSWTDGFPSSGAALGLVLEQNVFRATDRLVHRQWESRTGGTFRENLWLRDLSQGSARPFVFERFDNEERIPSLGHRFVDCVTSEDSLRVTHWANPGVFESERRYSVWIDVRDNAGKPVAGATVRLLDPDRRTVLSLSTDAAGQARGILLLNRIKPGPNLGYAGPFQVEVGKSGVGEFRQTFPIRGRFALRVDLSAGKGEVDGAAPAAPDAPRLHRLSATRMGVRWDTPTQESGIATYIVFLDGAPAVVCPQTDCIVSGLTPGVGHSIQVQAVDAAGLRSTLGPAISFGAVAEDRGP